MSETQEGEIGKNEAAKNELQSLDLDLTELVTFFDKKDDKSQGHATALVSIFGEELAIALLRVYCEAQGYGFKVLENLCSRRKQKGNRLDAWIRVDTEKKGGPIYYFQTEIKNWSAHAIGGEDIDLCIKDNKWNEVRFERFKSEFRACHIPEGSEKLKDIELKRGKGFTEEEKKENICEWKRILRSSKSKISYEPNNRALGKVILNMTEGFNRRKPFIKEYEKEYTKEYSFSVRKKKGNLVERGKFVKKKGDDVIEERNLSEEKSVKICPLICYWFALYPRPEVGEYKEAIEYDDIDEFFHSDEFFNLKLLGKNDSKLPKKGRRVSEDFDRLYVFSMSSFARNLLKGDYPEIVVTDSKKIEIKMKVLGKRQKWINKIFPETDKEPKDQSPTE